MSGIAHVIAVGGGGFSETRDPGLDAYILEQSRVPHPRIGFIGTASGDSDSYLAKFYPAFSKLDCRPSHIPLFRRTPDLAAVLADLDVVFVGGGNTRSMLAVWREWGLDRHLAEAGRNGTVLAGVSAGAICWFEEGITDSSSSGLESLPCLGFARGSCCPHYDGEAERRPAYQALVASGNVKPGWAIDDGAAVHIEGGGDVHCIAGREGAAVYSVNARDGRVDELEQPMLRVDA
jgi:dipeptidase E